MGTLAVLLCLILPGLAAATETPTGRIAEAPPALVEEGERAPDLKALLAGIEVPSAVNAVAYSPDGRTVATGCADGKVRLWDRAGGREVARLESSQGAAVNAIAFAPAGNTLAAGDDDGAVRIFDLATGKETARLQGHAGSVWALAYAPDGKALASGAADRTIRIWNPATGKETARLQGHTDMVNAVAFSPDGKELASAAGDATVRLWELATGRESARLEGHEHQVTAVAYAPDGRTLASGSRDGTVRLWDLATVRESARLETPAGVYALAYAPDGKTLISGGGTTRIWDLATGMETARLEGHTDQVNAVAYAPDGRSLVSGSNDRTARVWDVATARETLRLAGHANTVLSLAYSPDGRTLASGSWDNAARVWQLAKDRQVSRLEGHGGPVYAVAYGPDGRHLATGSRDRTIRIWDLALGQETVRLEGHSGSIWALAYAPDAKHLASGSGDGTARVWSLATGKEIIRLAGHRSTVYAVAYAPDGRHLATGSGDNTARIWDLRTGKETLRLEGHASSINALAYAPDGRTLATGSLDGTLRLWDLSSGKEVDRLNGPIIALKGHGNAVNAVAYAPDGKTLASGGADNTVRLWDTATGRETARLEGHTSSVNAVVFSPDGRTLASGSVDNTVRLWTRQSTGTWTFRAVLWGSDDGLWFAWKSDGTLVRADDGRLLRPFDPETARLDDWPPPMPEARGRVEIADPKPAAIETRDGEAARIRLKVHNAGGGPLYWLRLAGEGEDRAAGDEGHARLGFVPSPARLKLLPGDTAELEGFASYRQDYVAPKAGTGQLRLRVRHAHDGGQGPEQILPVQALNPDLAVTGANLVRGMRPILSIQLRNLGRQALGRAQYAARIAGLPPLNVVERPSIDAGAAATVSFDLPGEAKPDENSRVSVEVTTLDHPRHRWKFENRRIVIPPPPLVLYGAFALLLAATLAALYALSLYRHPLVQQLSRDPAALRRLLPADLGTAERLLRRTRRLKSVLRQAGVDLSRFRRALAYAAADPRSRGAHLAELVGAKVGEDTVLGPEFVRLQFPESFPLNLAECLLYQPPAEATAETVLDLLKRDRAHDRVMLILHPDPAVQARLKQAADDDANLYVAPETRALTHLLLSRDPAGELARLFSLQLPLTRISPYQTGGGVNKEPIFFGRGQYIAHVMNRDPANYLVVGGRQLGKSSLLKALLRRYRDRRGVRCFYLSLSGGEVVARLAHVLGLPTDSGMGAVADRIRESAAPCLFLIDEADDFMAAERGTGYGLLKEFRSLSETGRAFFILAGYWELYRLAALDFQSPLRNLGETLVIGALEEEACHSLAVVPMEKMDIHWADEALVDRLVRQAGGRANLIAIACNEILKTLDPARRRIDGDDLDRALDSEAIRAALPRWHELSGGDPRDAAAAQLVVYSTVRQEEFTLTGLLEGLEAEGVFLETARAERLLEALTLAYVVRREGERYRYCVPLFRQMLLERGPEALFRNAVREWREQRAGAAEEGGAGGRLGVSGSAEGLGRPR